MAKFEPSPHKEEAMQALREGLEANKNLNTLKEDVAKRFGLTIRTVERYVASINNPPAAKPVQVSAADAHTEEQTEAPKATARRPPSPSPKAVQGKVEMSKVATQGAAPTLFVLSGDTVPVMASDLDNAWQYYKEIQRMDPNVTDNFGTALCTCMRHVWRHLKDRVAMDIGNAILEQEEGSNGEFGGETSGPGQEEASAARAG